MAFVGQISVKAIGGVESNSYLTGRPVVFICYSELPLHKEVPSFAGAHKLAVENDEKASISPMTNMCVLFVIC